MQQPVIFRPAGYNERRCIARDTLSLYGSIVTTGTYTTHAQSHPELSKDDIYMALKYCILHQPVLGIVILDSGTEHPQLARASLIHLASHVHLLEEDRSIEKFLEYVHNQPLTDYETRPQWRVYVQPLRSGPDVSFRIAFASSHALADGASGLVVHKTFLEALCNLERSTFDSTPDFEPPAVSKILPPLDQAATFPISWSFLLRPLLSEFLSPWLSRMLRFGSGSDVGVSEEHVWSGPPHRPELPVPASGQVIVTAAEASRIPATTLIKVLNVCKAHDARLTGLLNHLTARALARMLHVRGEDYNKFIVDTAIDLRRCIPLAHDQMANFVSASNDTVTVKPIPLDATAGMKTEDWSSVQQMTQRLAEISNTLTDQPIALLKYLSKMRDWTLKKAGTAAEGSFGMSNLGTFDSKAGMTGDSGWTVEDMMFSQSADAVNAPFNINVASAKDGPLSIVLTWWPGMLGVNDERELAKEVLQDIVRELETIAR